MKKKLINVLFSKMAIVAYIILFELLLLFFFITLFSSISRTISILLRFLSIFMAIYIYNRNDNPSYKMAWIVLILLMPTVGGIAYLLFGGKKVSRELRRNVMNSKLNSQGILSQKDSVILNLKKESPEAGKQANYLMKHAGYPCMQNTSTTFIENGEKYFKYLLEEIEKAEKFVFLEYFILEEGKMLGTLLELLERKVHEGVDVRLLFDDAGCIPKVDEHFDERVKALGIKCKCFNPVKAQLAIQMNNRDHRKITVIDNKVGFTGGINLADEYINEKEVFGHWRDQGIMIKGEGVSSFTFMFLQFWDYGEKERSRYQDYLSEEKAESDGYVVPFSDTPTDEESVGKNAHLNMINNANEYVYIQTPYLILDNVVQDSLILASKNGVDVRIMVPGIPDKKLVNQVTKANYRVLLESGVRIYEYTPGFVHAKTMVSDDQFGVIGSINLDYRSYFLHFECGIWLFKSKAILDCRDDFLKTLDECHEITYEEYKKTNVLVQLVRLILNLFSPLL